MHADRVEAALLPLPPVSLTAFLSYILDIPRVSCVERWERVTRLDDSRNERRQIIFFPLLLNASGTCLLLRGF